ncbi:hypothetical protein G4228_015002 [Cervus hanglu yarkandensis]|nr:hypothetical protein G4228_015002 [Cervus hanglu yarkandensis]
MPKRRAGSRKGWYAQQRRSLEERMRLLTIQETVPLPTAQQIQALLQIACENASNPSPASPTSILISLLLLLNQISSMEASIFWAYVPDPPLLQPVGWEMSSVPVYVNDTILLGGFSDKHIFPQNASISYTGSSSQLPMCFFRNHNVSGCLTVTDVGYSDYSTGWSVDIPGVTRLTGHAQRRNGMGPQDIPFCGLGHKGKHIAVPWKLCRNETATVYSIPNSTHSLWDWLPDSERNPGKESNRQFAARIWNLGGTLVYQTEVWKLLAAFETSGSFMQTGEKVKGGFFWNATWRYPRACVPYPFMIIAGSVNLTKNNSQYYIHCFNCTLTNCIRGIRNNSGVLIVKQPPFVKLPVNLTEPWYEEPGLELWNKVRTALARPRRGIGLIILGVVTLITLIASAVTASVSLAQSVHTASIVDDLAKNTSKALGIQEDIDRKLEDRLNALYNPIAQSTDGARTKIGFGEGRHAREVWWEGPLGTVAVIGIATKRAPTQCQGYVALLGSDDQSWGWNLVDNNLLHNGEVNGSFPQCNNAPKYQIGERIRVILDMEDKTLAFERGYEFLGVAFRGLPKVCLYPAVSAVYGNTEVTLVYLGKPLGG